VKARLLPVPQAGENGESPRIRQWLQQIWKEKDQAIAEILNPSQATAA